MDHKVEIIDFIKSKGILVTYGPIEEETFLPGVKIVEGTLLVDDEKLPYPGDLLHEAGHIAVMSPAQRSALTGNVTEVYPEAQGEEVGAILWSYAAAKAMKLPLEVLFHPDGYKGESGWLIETMERGEYIGLPLLEWMGMAYGPAQAAAKGVEPFPAMQTWLRQ